MKVIKFGVFSYNLDQICAFMQMRHVGVLNNSQVHSLFKCLLAKLFWVRLKTSLSLNRCV